MSERVSILSTIFGSRRIGFILKRHLCRKRSPAAPVRGDLIFRSLSRVQFNSYKRQHVCHFLPPRTSSQITGPVSRSPRLVCANVGRILSGHLSARYISYIMWRCRAGSPYIHSYNTIDTINASVMITCLVSSHCGSRRHSVYTRVV